MDKINDGGPAFPSESYDAEVDMDTVKPGMSLRDWFAGQALAGYVAHLGAQGIHAGGYVAECAQEAFAIADAMLVERAKRSAQGES